MGKTKKGKRETKDGDVDDDLEVETSVANDLAPDKDKKGKTRKKIVDDTKVESSDDESDEIVKEKKGKGKTEKKMEDKLSEQLEDLTIDTGTKKTRSSKKNKTKAAEESSEEEQMERAPVKGKKKANFELVVQDSDSEENDKVVSRTKPSKVSVVKNKGFSLLEVDGDSSDSDVQMKDTSDEDLETKPTRPESKKGGGERTDKKEEKGGKKGKKGKKKKQDDDDEDIEKVLAELEMEYSGIKKEEAPVANEVKEVPEVVAEEDNKKDKKKAKKKGLKAEGDTAEGGEEVQNTAKLVVDGEELEGTVKTAAQKKKEKKERDKQKKQSQKTQDPTKKEDKPESEGKADDAREPAEKTTTAAEAENSKKENAADGQEEGAAEDEEDDSSKKKKKKKGKPDELDKGKDKKGPGKKMIAAMQETLKKLREEEERLAREEEERQQKLEEAEKARQEQLRLEQERKERKKQKEREKKERLKAEGKLLTPKQRAERARAQAMLEALKAQGIDMPGVGEKKAPRPGTRVRPGKAKQQASVEPEQAIEEQKVEVQIVDSVQKEPEAQEPKDSGIKDSWEEDEAIKDSWDAESSGAEDDKSETSKGGSDTANVVTRQKSRDDEPEEDQRQDENAGDSEEGTDSENEDSGSESEDSEDEHKTDAEKKRERALERIRKRREVAELNMTVENLRAAVVCVLGHVDTGKTKILDKLRRTNVQDGEAGGITQQIGATNVPIDAIKEQTKIVKEFPEIDFRIPGLLIIDTPGHESFSNLRNRGSSLCDIAILVVDIMHGLEPQTIESISLLKSKKTPFVVALNKIDRLYDWQTMNRKDVRDILKSQAANTQLEFQQRTKEVIVQFAEQGLNAALFYENPDVRSYVSLVPTSAITGEGMGNLLALIVDFCQNKLAKRLMYSEELQATVLEVKAIPGLGTTIDAILVNGKLREGDTMVVAGTDGPIVTQIRSLLMPQPLKELRVKNAYVEYKEIKAAQGVKIAAKDLEKAIAGLNLLVAQKPDEVEILRSEVGRELKSALGNIKLQERGVYVQASTLGSLEALLEFLRTSKIPYSNIRIGPVVKKDVMKASTMLEHDSQYATILAFDVKVERDAQELADTLGVKIFQADIIYHLFDKFTAYREELRQRKRDEFKSVAVFPCKLRVLPQFVFNSRDPIVVGVMIEAGIVREGTPICVPSKEFVDLGVVTSIENNHKPVESARKGQEVCVKIEPVAGDSPKMFGRHFDEKDFLISKISRQSIDACKNYFRDDLAKTDWQLMVELKKLFEIL
ncbi:eukaryotic translation initiation factor 5B [Bacillus rossius redtenbacheri]|uniref:eukaryotic translation initiation factor 5B n=1 Tax=Bacillus rossius redtenbacheri TaxID=93214 RepID=UPI002FDCADE4